MWWLLKMKWSMAPGRLFFNKFCNTWLYTNEFLFCVLGCIIIPLLEPLPKFGSRWQPQKQEAAWTIPTNWRMSSAAKMSYSTTQQPPSASTESSTNQIEVDNRLFPRCTATTPTNTSTFQKTNSSSTTVKKKTKKKKSATSTSSGAGTKATKKVYY